MKNPLKRFCSWLEQTDDYGGSVSALLLIEYPTDTGSLRLDPKKELIDLLMTIKEGSKSVGMCLYIQNTVDFIIEDYDDIDKSLDSINFFKSLAKDNPESADTFANMAKSEPNKFQDRKLFKQQWELFKADCFNFNYFRAYETAYLSNKLRK